MHFKKTELKNGIRVLSEMHPQSRAVSIGIWVLTGTRDESPSEAGISHFLEHLVFKGTKSRSAYQIAKSLEAVGGELNAYTTREHTLYHCLVLKEHWKKGLEVLSDLVTNMHISKEDLELERSVIMQEIAMGEDDLEDLSYDIFFEKSLPKSPLGKPILGNIKSISKINMKQVHEHYEKYYSGNNIIVSASGAIDHHDLLEEVEKYLGKKKKSRLRLSRTKPHYKVVRHVMEKPSEQMHLCMGLPVTSFKDKMRFEAFIVNALLGGGMTSKLYQRIREKRGLVYTIYSSLNTFDDYGTLNVYVSCDKSNLKSVYKSIISEMKKLRKQKISEHDLSLYKTQVKGAILLGADDVENRMSSIAVNEMIFGKYKEVDDVIEEIDKVTTASVNEFIKKFIITSELSMILLGAEAKKFEEWFMNAEA